MRKLPLLALAAALLAGCTAAETSARTEAPAAARFAPAPPPLEPEPYEFTTAIVDDAYQHPRLDAFVHATIRWWNTDNETHSVVSDDGQFPGSGPIAPHGEFVHTFLRAGDYAFHCRYHPEMTGTIIVR